MIDQLGQCDYMYFQWSMIKSQQTPITKGGTSQSNLHWTFFTQLLLHTVTGSILNSYTDLPFFTGHLGPFSHLGIKIMAWWTNQSQGCSLLIRYQTFAWKKFYWEIGLCQKTYKYLLFKRFFYPWKSNNHQVFNHIKICLLSLLLTVPKEIVKELNQMILNFFWKGTDKVTRLSTINEYENGGLKMFDLERKIKSLQLAWLKRIFQCNNGAWRSFLWFSLEPFGGLFLFHCN